MAGVVSRNLSQRGIAYRVPPLSINHVFACVCRPGSRTKGIVGPGSHSAERSHLDIIALHVWLHTLRRIQSFFLTVVSVAQAIPLPNGDILFCPCHGVLGYSERKFVGRASSLRCLDVRDITSAVRVCKPLRLMTLREALVIRVSVPPIVYRAV